MIRDSSTVQKSYDYIDTIVSIAKHIGNTSLLIINLKIVYRVYNNNITSPVFIFTHVPKFFSYGRALIKTV